jgi:Septum formation
VAALIVGLVSLVLFFAFIPALVAVVLAVVAGFRIKRSAGARTGRALAGIGGGLGLISIVMGVVVIALVVSSHLFDGHLTRYADLQLGDCFDQPSGIIRLYRRLPCKRAHDHQVVGVILDPASANAGYPGTAALIQEGRGQCAAASSSFLLPPGASYRQTFYYPNKLSWDNGERRILCLVGNADGSKLPGDTPKTTGNLSARHTPDDNGANIGA